MLSDGQLTDCLGCDAFWQRGEIRKDTGYFETAGFPDENPILSIDSFFGGLNAILTIENTEGGLTIWKRGEIGPGVYTWELIDAAEWAAYSNHVANSVYFLGNAWLVGWNPATANYLPTATITDETVPVFSLVEDMAQGKYIVNYRDRLYFLGAFIDGTEYPYRVAYTDEPVGGEVTYSGSFLDVDYQDEVTGGASAFDRLFVFTRSATWLYNQTEFKKQNWPGCANHHAIQVTDVGLVWASESAVWLSTGSKPSNVSQDIAELVMASDPTVWQSAYNRDENTYWLYLGDTKANNEEVKNCVVTLSLDLAAAGTPVWKWRSLAVPMTAMAELITADGRRVHFGSSLGHLFQKSRPDDATPVWTDNGVAIKSNFRTGWLDGGDPTTIKKVTGIVAYCQNAAGLELWWRKMDRQLSAPSEWVKAGKCDGNVSILTKTIDGNFIQIEGRDYSGRQGWSLHGLSLMAQVEGKEK